MKKYWAFFLFFLILGGIFIFLYNFSQKKEEFNFSLTFDLIKNRSNQIFVLASLSQNQIISLKTKPELIWQILNEERIRNHQLKEEITNLTEELKKIVENLEKISEKTKREKIEIAIHYQLETLTNLVSYTQLIDAFIKELEEEKANKEEEKILENYQKNLKESLAKAQKEYQQFLEIINQIQ